MLFSGLNKNQLRGQILNRSQLELCLFCEQRGTENAPLNRYCGCPRLAHLNCLTRHIQFSRNSYCDLCLAPFQNVKIIYPNRSCAAWLREDQATRYTFVRFLTFVLLVIYLEYLSLLQLAVQYQIMSPIERYVLQILMFFFLYLIILVFLFFTLFLLGTYVTFRRTTGHVNVIPLNQPAFNQLAFNQLAFNQAAFSRPTFNQPTFNQPSKNQSNLIRHPNSNIVQLKDLKE